ncbi:hypothetical protein Salat_2430000 [Sesamum alatum]|uniref:Uncharacterized protein n=1 Tax=Sesamum alatum TaxID=300844 RepID=A0AAE2CFE6_9LAMI|nr:hypothetical protein Salat_2430000 [Sesamum alatum]
METQSSEPIDQMSMETNATARNKGKRVMFSKNQQPNPQQDQEAAVRQKGSESGNYLKENLRTNITDETGAEAIHQNCSQEIVEDSEDDFNYDDPIIAELLDKDWIRNLLIIEEALMTKQPTLTLPVLRLGLKGV